jgi:hypothetical protein
MVVGADGSGAAAATLTGSVWHVLRPVERQGTGRHAYTAADFESVSCPSTTDCIAVGDSEPELASNANPPPLAEQWNGTRWSMQTTSPLKPRDWGQSFSSVSCPAATTCVATAKIGSDAAGTGADGAAEIWRADDRQWRNAGLTGAGWLLGVSCASDEHCVAISAAAIYTWNGLRWHRQRVPGNLDTHEPSAIACASLTRCAVTAGFWPALSLVLRGRTWTVHPMPGVRGNDWTDIGGLSCPAANSCTAVGSLSAHNQYNTSTPLAEHWNGTSWHLERIAPVRHPVNTSLNSVWCPNPADCVIVGGDTIDGIAMVERSS